MSNQKSSDALFQLDGKISVRQAVPFGLQHILAMFVANITPIIIVASACGLTAEQSARLIQTAMIIAGVGTLIQLFPIAKRVGSGLPIVMGISFTFVSIFCYLGPIYGYPVVLGAIIVGGIIEGILGLFVKYWIKLISPIVSASVVTAIGFSLLSVGASSFGGGSSNDGFGSATNWIVGVITLCACLLFHIFAKGFWKQLSVLVGLVVGYIVALFAGIVDLSSVATTSIISLPSFLGIMPEFNISAIIAVTLIFLVSATETIGDTAALAATGLGRDVTPEETAGSLACDGFVSTISGLFGCLPITSFSQNVGIVAMTKVVNRIALASGAVIMIIAGLFPIVGNILATLPDAVLGGCTVMLFGTIVVSGLQMVSKCGFSQRNITIVALSLSVGIGFTQVSDIFAIFPTILQNVFAENCVAVVFVVSILLNLLLPKEAEATEEA